MDIKKFEKEQSEKQIANETFPIYDEGIKDFELSDEDYWKRYSMKETDEECFGNELHHPISVNISIDFFGLNGKIYSTKEENLSCNPRDLDKWMVCLKKAIRMCDEFKGDNVGDGTGGIN